MANNPVMEVRNKKASNLLKTIGKVALLVIFIFVVFDSQPLWRGICAQRNRVLLDRLIDEFNTGAPVEKTDIMEEIGNVGFDGFNLVILLKSDLDQAALQNEFCTQLSTPLRKGDSFKGTIGRVRDNTQKLVGSELFLMQFKAALEKAPIYHLKPDSTYSQYYIITVIEQTDR